MNRAALVRHPVALAGVVIATVSAVVFIALVIAMSIGFLTDPYAGLMVFVALPAVFVAGLLVIPVGMALEQRRLRAQAQTLSDWPVIDLRESRTRRVALTLVALTAANVVIVLVAGYGSLTWMESPSFCGQVCHEPMHPQYTTWQNGPHLKVTCVQCHIGEGAQSFVHYKLNGVRQLVHVVTNNYARPIAANADLRPAIETCGTCHGPERDRTERLRVSHEYADDAANTETVTALLMQMGGPGQPAPNGKAIHWHADQNIRVEFISTDEGRQVIPYVKVTDAKGQVKEFMADGVTADALPAGDRRRMDCIDCHNVVAHRVAPTPEQAIDRAIASGRISRALPFVRREGIRLVKADYPSSEAASRTIDQGLRTFYASQGAPVDGQTLSAAVQGVQRVYDSNVFPTMNVTFGTYPDNVGHTTSQGCFRCHDGGHTAKDGSSIPFDCDTCHKQIDRAP